MTDTAQESLYDDPAATNGTGPEPAGGGEAPSLSCPDCGFTAKSGGGLSRHRFMKHGRVGPQARPSGAERAPKTQKERKPAGPAGRRMSLAEIGTGIWRALSWGAAQGGHGAASRAFQIQAEAAGPAFDRLVKGTFFDRMLQPIAKVGDNAKDIGTLVALPATAEAYMQNPNQMTATAFKSALLGSLPQIARAHKDVVKRQARLEADLADLAEMFGKQPGDRVSLDEVAMWLLYGAPDAREAEEPVDAEVVT